MAHRQLAEKYAKQLKEVSTQLNEANCRIIELETTVADRDCHVEQSNVTTPPSSVMQHSQAGQRIELLEAAAKADRDQLHITAEENHTLSQRVEAAEHRASQLDKRLQDRPFELQRLMARVVELRQELEASKMKGNDLQDQVQMSKSNETVLREQNDALTASESAARTQLSLKDIRIASLEEAATPKDPPVFDFGRGFVLKGELQAKVDKIAKLETSLDREKKRRLEAEALLGPDGKRCKKCNPIVVNLMDEDDNENASATESVAADKAVSKDGAIDALASLISGRPLVPRGAAALRMYTTG